MFTNFITDNETPQDKRCIGCNNRFPLSIEYFRENANKSDGYSQICYECEVTYKATTSQKCIACGNVFPLSSQYWKKRKETKIGFVSECLVCMRAREKQWKTDNHERYLQKKRIWISKNIERVNESKLKYQINNKEKIALSYKSLKEKFPERYKSYQKRYADKNREKINEKHRLYYNNNKDKIAIRSSKYQKENAEKVRQNTRNWRKNNPEKYLSCLHRRRVLLSANQENYTKDDVYRIYELQDKKCLYCGIPMINDKALATKEVPFYTIDHYIPITKGGGNNAENIVLACGVCNSRKNNKLPEEFKTHMQTRYGITIKIRE